MMSILPLPAPPTDGNHYEAISQKNLPASQVSDEKKAKPAALVATHTRAIGVIHPPPDIRKIIDTTSEHVAKHGPQFEKLILSKAGIPKFNFLSASHPYHAYYQHKLSEVCVRETHVDDFAATTEKTEPAANFMLSRKVLEPPETEQYTVRLPEGITADELDIIKLTAQFVARNGKSFLTGITTREMNNPQFHFLKPAHSMFMLFTALADAYSKCLMPPEGLTDKLKKSVVDRTTVLERCLHRLEWDKSQEQARQNAEHEIEHEKMQMSLIDWHDFVAVETIEFVDDEDQILPMPMTLEEVVRRSKISTRDGDGDLDTGKVVAMEMDEEEMQLVQEGLGENGDDLRNEVVDDPPMRIVKNWKRPEDKIPAGRESSGLVVSPITGELIPTDEMSEHIRISLIDPKYKLQKERMFAKIRETTLAQDDEISRNIAGLARTRPDIFGTTEEEVSNAVKAEIQKKEAEQPNQVIWDGHTGSVSQTPNQAALPPPRPVIPLIRPLPQPVNLALNMPRMPTNTIPYSTVNMMPFQHRPPMVPTNQMMMPFQHRMPLPPPPMSQVMPPPPSPMSQVMPPPPPMPQVMLFPPPPMSQVMPPPPPPPEEAPPLLPEEPEPKRRKLDDSALVPEDLFIAQHPGPVTISVSVPSVDEQNLNKHVLQISMHSLSENIGSLKEKISTEIQLPANKQKLSGKAGFLKDNFTLAYYNIGTGDSLTLSLRERGGRKK